MFRVLSSLCKIMRSRTRCIFCPEVFQVECDVCRPIFRKQFSETLCFFPYQIFQKNTAFGVLEIFCRRKVDGNESEQDKAAGLYDAADFSVLFYHKNQPRLKQFFC